jgi:hypothetical protein
MPQIKEDEQEALQEGDRELTGSSRYHASLVVASQRPAGQVDL